MSWRNLSTGLFGGNLNGVVSIRFPVNFLSIESLQKFHFFLGDHYKVERPTGSGQCLTSGKSRCIFYSGSRASFATSTDGGLSSAARKLSN